MKQLVRPLVVALGLIVPTFAAPALASAQEVVAQAPEVNYAPPPPAPQTEAAGQWVDTDAYGWIWVPNNTETVDVNAQPYAYVYTPTYGWTWYVSPWGRGRYYAGPWVHAHYGAPHVWYGGRWAATPGYRVGVHPAPVYRPAVRYNSARPVYHAPPAHRR